MVSKASSFFFSSSWTFIFSYSLIDSIASSEQNFYAKIISFYFTQNSNYSWHFFSFKALSLNFEKSSFFLVVSCYICSNFHSFIWSYIYCAFLERVLPRLGKASIVFQIFSMRSIWTLIGLKLLFVSILFKRDDCNLFVSNKNYWRGYLFIRFSLDGSIKMLLLFNSMS